MSNHWRELGTGRPLSLRTHCLTAVLMVPILAQAQLANLAQSGGINATWQQEICWPSTCNQRLYTDAENLVNVASGDQSASIFLLTEHDKRPKPGVTGSLNTHVSSSDIQLDYEVFTEALYEKNGLNNEITNWAGFGNVDASLSFDVATQASIWFSHSEAAPGIDSYMGPAGVPSYKGPFSSPDLVLLKRDASGSLSFVWQVKGPLEEARLLEAGRYVLTIKDKLYSSYATTTAVTGALHISAVPEASTLSMWILGGFMLMVPVARRQHSRGA